MHGLTYQLSSSPACNSPAYFHFESILRDLSYMSADVHPGDNIGQTLTRRALLIETISKTMIALTRTIDSYLFRQHG
jgi:hypothetical protein